MTTDLITTRTADTHFDAAIHHLRALSHHGFLEYAVSIGQYLVNHFSGGDFAAIHSQDPNKPNSFQRFLTERRDALRDIGLSGSTLRRYIAATEVWHGLPESTRSQLGLDHIQRLAAIPDVTERKRLAHDAATQHWTRDQVGHAVKEAKAAKRKGHKKPGPKPLPAIVKLAVQLHAHARRLARQHGAATRLDDDHKAQFQADVEAVRKLLQSLA